MKAGGRRWLRLTGLTLVVALFSTVLVAGGAAATQTDQPADESSFVVELQDDGAAAVTITYTFDLDSDDEQAAFEELRTDDDALETFRDRFDRRLREVAADASNATGREMSVSGVTVETEQIDRTGVVTVSLTWDGLAATETGQLSVTEPFASGFEPDRPLYVTAPDGYEFTSTTPEPDQRATRSLGWTAGSDLTGFETVATAPEDGETSAAGTDGDNGTDSSDGSTAGADDSGPGFGLFPAAVGIVAGALYARRRS